MIQSLDLAFEIYGLSSFSSACYWLRDLVEAVAQHVASLLRLMIYHARVLFLLQLRAGPTFSSFVDATDLVR